jgi:hypothetical protein
MYRDWLVVNKEKNQGSTFGSKNHETSTKSIRGGSKNLIGKGSFFSLLNEAETQLGDENVNVNMSPQFHPRGGVVSNNVWTNRNKRARGMGNKPNEPNKPVIVTQPPKAIGSQPRQPRPSIGAAKPGRVSYPTYCIYRLSEVGG